MDLDKVGERVGDHKAVAAIGGGASLALVAGVVARGRKKGENTNVTVPGYLSPQSFTSGGGASGNAYDPYQGWTPVTPDWVDRIVNAPAPSTVSTAPPPPSTPAPSTSIPSYSVPTAMPSLAPITGVTFDHTVTNPVGYTDYEALRNQGTYTPSQLDYQTEQPGGLQWGYLNVDGTAGHTAVVYNSQLGTGPVVPVGSRIVGERYDIYGRVIA